MSKVKIAELSERQKMQVMSQVVKSVIGFNGSQLKELRRFVDLLLQIRQQQGKGDEE